MRKICSLEDIPASGCMEFILSGREGEISCFLVHHDGRLAAYRNRCPHTGAPLNWSPNVFLNLEQTHIQCDMHGAQFCIEDGHCLYGPCTGHALEPVDVVEKEGEVWLLAEYLPKVP